MFQFWFAPRFSSGARLGLIGIRTLAARWRGDLGDFRRGSALWGSVSSAR